MLERICLGAAVIVAILLMLAASQPALGKITTPHWHYAVHFAAFAFLAALSVIGIPRVPFLTVTLAVVLFAFLHESYEIVGHAHGFELSDAVVDGLGAVAGAYLARRLTTRLGRKP